MRLQYLHMFRTSHANVCSSFHAYPDVCWPLTCVRRLHLCEHTHNISTLQRGLRSDVRRKLKWPVSSAGASPFVLYCSRPRFGSLASRGPGAIHASDALGMRCISGLEAQSPQSSEARSGGLGAAAPKNNLG